MIFLNSSNSFFILGFVILLSSYLMFYNKKKNLFLFKYWQMEPSIRKKISQFFFITSIIILFISLLDIRGEIKKIKVKKIKMNTVIVIDTSASMAVEDVTPNRFKKAVFLARHLVKNISNNEIAIMVFSDKVKMLSPFTQDVDFLDTKLKSLSEIDIVSGGSKINNAIYSADNYLQQFSDIGNIVIFSDGESHSRKLQKYKIKSNIFFVGIGTFSGGEIPVRSNDGTLMYFKKSKGNVIISKLSKNYLDKLESFYPKFKYFTPLNYGVPSKDIAIEISKRTSLKSSISNEDTRPVIGIKLILLGLVLLIISFMLNFGKTFFYNKKISLLLLVFSFNSYAINRNKYINKNVDKDKVKSKLITEFNLKKGDYTYKELNELANRYILKQDYKSTTIVYDEIVSLDKSISTNPYFKSNIGVTMALSNRFKKGLDLLVEASVGVKSDDKKNVYQNILLLLNSSSKKKKSGNKNDQKKSKNQKNRKANKASKKNSVNKDGKKGKLNNQDKKTVNKKMSYKEKEQRKRERSKMNEIVNLIENMDKEMQKRFLKTNRRRRKYGRQFDW